MTGKFMVRLKAWMELIFLRLKAGGLTAIRLRLVNLSENSSTMLDPPLEDSNLPVMGSMESRTASKSRCRRFIREMNRLS